MNVIDFPDDANGMDVPTSLVRLATELSGRQIAQPDHAIVVIVTNGQIEVIGCGRCGDRAHEVGTLYMAAMSLALK